MAKPHMPTKEGEEMQESLLVLFMIYLIIRQSDSMFSIRFCDTEDDSEKERNNRHK